MTLGSKKVAVDSPAKPGPASRGTHFLCHAAAWYGLIFATPVLVALTNQQDIFLSILLLVPVLIILFAVLSLTGWGLSLRLGTEPQKAIAAGMLTIAFMLAIQGNLVHPLTYFGQFDGSMVFFRRYGILFWLEWYGFLLGFIILFYLFNRASNISVWLPWIPVLSFTLVLGNAFFNAGTHSAGLKSLEFDDSVFNFSTSRNLIHLLPDALQSDIVEQVLRENPKLADRFQGFTLYSDHLGLYYGTAPSLPAMLTGRPFDFEEGHTYEWITPAIEEYSYQNKLAEDDFKIDIVPIVDAYCISRANSCVPRPFSGWKSWGYRRYRVDSASYSMRILADLTIYRLSPSFLKEKIYAGGEWMLADSKLDGASPWPDPVIREWIENMRVVDDSPHYKFYHYIGTHRPAVWTSDCRRTGEFAQTREYFLGQTQCILTGIAALIEKLQKEGIYDQTAIIISGDHGLDIAPGDFTRAPQSIMLNKEKMGTARPALLVKRMGASESLQISQLPTSVIDIAPIAQSIAGVEMQDETPFEKIYRAGKNRDRYFYDYPLEMIRRWSTEPIPHDVYRVRGPAHKDSSWELLKLKADHSAPDEYPLISHGAVAEYMRGVRVRQANTNQKHAWIIRKQLAFLISIRRHGPQPQTLVVTLNIPDWIGKQSFSVRVNETKIDEKFYVTRSKKYWQEVHIRLPGSSLKEGNNFISLNFDKLNAAPKSGVAAAAILRAIRVE